jgi:hypothetical protein
MAAAWACCCFKTGMHGAWHAAASKPGCMVHGMLLLQQQQQLLRARVRACVAAFVIDTIYELTHRRRPSVSRARPFCPGPLISNISIRKFDSPRLT